MTLATLLYPSPTEYGWEEFLHAHVRHHEAIIDAIREVKGVALQLQPLYPGDPTDDGWERAHQEAHVQMNGVLELQGTDLTSLDLKDKRKMDEWIFEHFSQHQAAAQASGMPI